MSKHESKIFVKHHLGMGDNIVHNGIIRKISKDNPNSKIFLAAKHHNFKNTEYMFRDNPKITVLSVTDDYDMNRIISNGDFNKIISSHFEDGNPYKYEEYFDDAFYMLVNMNPSIKTENFYIERDNELESKIFKELITDKGIEDYLFVHEKPEIGIILNRNKMEQGLPIITADSKYGMFELLKVIENAKSVHLISSSFLSLMMCKKYNSNVFAHMYVDRPHIAPYVKKHNIEVLL